MRSGGRLTLTSRERWVICADSDVSAEERPHRVDPAIARHLIDEWCNDVVTWPDMVALYGQITGDQVHAQSSLDVESVIKPVLRRAFQMKHFVALKLPPFPARQRKKVDGAHTAGKKLDVEIPQQAGPRILRVASDKTFLDLKVVDTKGRPLAGRRYRMQLPDGHTEQGVLSPDGRLGKTNIDPGIGRFALVPEPGEAVAKGDLPPPPPAKLKTAVFSVRVVTSAGEPLSGLGVLFATPHEQEVVKTDGDGVARFECPADPPPTARLADAARLPEQLASRSAAG